MRHRSIRPAAIAALIIATASLAQADVVFEDTFAYTNATELLDPSIGGWTAFNGNPTITTAYAVPASGSGYISANHLPPVQNGYSLVQANNRGVYHNLGETLTGDWKVSISMLVSAYSRSASIGLMDANGNNGYGFSLNTSSPNSFSGKGFSTLRKIDTWVTSAFTATQGTQLGANAPGVSYPNGFALPAGGPWNTTDGIPYAPDAPFLGFTTFELSWSPSGVLTLTQDGSTVRTLTDTSFNSFSRIYFGSGSLGFFDNVTIEKNVAIASSAWNVDSDGAWTTASNWTGSAVPNGVGALASFGNVATAPRIVTLDANQTVGGLDFSSSAAFTIAGTNTLTLDSTSGPATINVGAGSHIISAPVVLNDNLSLIVVGGTSLAVADANLAGRVVTKNGGGTAQFGTVRAAELNLGVGIIRLAEKETTNAPEGTGNVQALTIGATGKLDLTNNSFVYDYTGASPLATIGTLIATAYAGGTWTGATGIGSASAAAAAINPEILRKTAIGFAEASDLVVTSFGGQSFTGDAIVFRYTIYGDANLDGTVNFDDLLRVAQNYDAAGTGKTWSDGDSNYDGVVEFSDLLLVAQYYNASLSELPANVSPAFAADWALALSLAPEPASLSLLAGIALMTRRRR